MQSGMSVIHIARVCHNVNKAYCEAMGDTSQPDWEDAPEWQRESAIAGAMAILQNPNTTPEQSHESWMKQKADDGWTFGTVKDPIAKTHPCFRPYAELPVEQKAKDHIFGAVVRSLAFTPVGASER